MKASLGNIETDLAPQRQRRLRLKGDFHGSGGIKRARQRPPPALRPWVRWPGMAGRRRCGDHGKAARLVAGVHEPDLALPGLTISSERAIFASRDVAPLGRHLTLYPGECAAWLRSAAPKPAKRSRLELARRLNNS